MKSDARLALILENCLEKSIRDYANGVIQILTFHHCAQRSIVLGYTCWTKKEERTIVPLLFGTVNKSPYILFILSTKKLAISFKIRYNELGRWFPLTMANLIGQCVDYSSPQFLAATKNWGAFFYLTVSICHL
ncbi:hypothetical protein [Enterococcus sp. DIV2417]|uniref:hypothetical protein n=1 Tax=Enterococcus sp. DIV2417 TaxID=2774994 RepID=UPI001ACB5007|nr:hypothetical protein [Enterococcus sp. DIV1271a]